MENNILEGVIVDDAGKAVSLGYSSQSSQTTLFNDSDCRALATTTPPICAVDLTSRFLDTRRNARTRTAYKTDFRAFFGEGATPADVLEFLTWPPPKIAAALEAHKTQMFAAGLGESAVNRRMAAMRSLLKFAFRMGISQTDGRGLVDSEKVRTYRDTRGPDELTVAALLKTPARVHGRTPELKAKNKVLILRDSAMLILCIENGLRRNEISNLTVGDFSLAQKRLFILGKGRGTQREPVTLSPKAARMIGAYLLEAGHEFDAGAPLFRNLDHRPDKCGRALSGAAIYKIISNYGRALGIDLHPHALRHAAITIASQRTNGNVEKVRKFSRHADANTVMKYIDNAADSQGEITNLLSDLFADDDE